MEKQKGRRHRPDLATGWEDQWRSRRYYEEEREREYVLKSVSESLADDGALCGEGESAAAGTKWQADVRRSDCAWVANE